jgi:hypothetical protein
LVGFRARARPNLAAPKTYLSAPACPSSTWCLACITVAVTSAGSFFEHRRAKKKHFFLSRFLPLAFIFDLGPPANSKSSAFSEKKNDGEEALLDRRLPRHSCRRGAAGTAAAASRGRRWLVLLEVRLGLRPPGSPPQDGGGGRPGAGGGFVGSVRKPAPFRLPQSARWLPSAVLPLFSVTIIVHGIAGVLVVL